MSYNESLRSNSNYPPMSQSEWDSAPFNEKEIPLKEFDCTVSQTISKSSKITTNEYYLEEDEEDGSRTPVTDDVDWGGEYLEQHYTPLQLIEILKNMCIDMIGVSELSKRFYKYKFLKKIIKECEDWGEDEFEVISE